MVKLLSLCFNLVNSTLFRMFSENFILLYKRLIKLQCYINKNSTVFQMHSVRFQVLFNNLFGPLCCKYAPGIPCVCVIMRGVVGLKICISSLCSENYH